MRLLVQLTHPPAPARAPLRFLLDGAEVAVPDDGGSLLDALREHLGSRSAKDGCSPQGQCGCCTVWVDGAPRVSCVTPARRVAGRSVTTLDGIDPEVRARWADAFSAAGASQCGFCTPGIIMRLAALEARRGDAGDAEIERALLAHLCRCTGWRTIVEAAHMARPSAPAAGDVPPDPPGARARGGRDLAGAARRAALEGGCPQSVGPAVACGGGGFAEDGAPAGALVAVPDGRGGWVLGPTLAAARRRAGRVPGRNSTRAVRHPLAPPPGDFDLVLQTAFVEPAYLEPDASWCQPGGEPATALANGGAFGGKTTTPVGAVARRLADEHGRPVRVVLSREDVARTGPKRPPVAAGVRADGSGVLRVARTPGAVGLDRWVAAAASVAPALMVELVDVPGPPVSADLRAAGWGEAAVLLGALSARAAGAGRHGHPVTVTSPQGGRATVAIDDHGAVSVRLAGGDPLDEVVLRSYAIGAVHQGLGWVRSEAIAVDEDGSVLDLTIRSFGILPARDMPAVDVVVEDDPRPPVAAGDSVFVATAIAAWLAAGLPGSWPVQAGGAT
ncbi:MAG TPA: 2Fe-2S iron-sulfur cluster-binding protein [Acidimicrobiales bacterium]|nr:2Fe-2S iron-sulfur cluster-binding protein [Acidimicrobiales bacterium]